MKGVLSMWGGGAFQRQQKTAWSSVLVPVPGDDFVQALLKSNQNYKSHFMFKTNSTNKIKWIFNRRCKLQQASLQ
jgi:hypothetical protein